jgi:hypothetical protein
MTVYALNGLDDHPGILVWMAWRRYLTSVRASDPGSYEVVEASAWERLQEELDTASRPPATVESLLGSPPA